MLRDAVQQTALELARRAAGVLRERAGLENARLEAELLLAAVLHLSRLELYLQHDRPVSTEELDAFRTLVRRRLRHEPIQYIVGEAPFRQLMLRVDSRVLIPRPETEILVGAVLAWAKGRPGLEVLDMGTGSGAIALSLAHEGDFQRIVATDVSADALAAAGENASRLGLQTRIEFRIGDAWSAVGTEERFDVVASNPPYVADAERAELAPEVREWEPAGALFAAERGYAMLNALVDGAAAHLEAGGLLALEVGLGQAEAVQQRLREHGSYAEPRVQADLTGRPRVILAQRS